MLQLSITLLFTAAAVLSCMVVASVLRRAWSAAGELRADLAECSEVEIAGVRTYAIEQRAAPAPLRVIQGGRAFPAGAPCGLRAAA